MLDPKLKEIRVVPNCTTYDLKFYTGRTDETRADFSEVASKYQGFGTTFYEKTNFPSNPNLKSTKQPGGIICPKIFVREKTIEGQVELERVELSDLRSDDRELVRIVIEELKAKDWKVAK